jgi:hypothetical protein
MKRGQTAAARSILDSSNFGRFLCDFLLLRAPVFSGMTKAFVKRMMSMRRLSYSTDSAAFQNSDSARVSLGRLPLHHGGRD